MIFQIEHTPPDDGLWHRPKPRQGVAGATVPKSSKEVHTLPNFTFIIRFTLRKPKAGVTHEEQEFTNYTEAWDEQVAERPSLNSNRRDHVR